VTTLYVLSVLLYLVWTFSWISRSTQEQAVYHILSFFLHDDDDDDEDDDDNNNNNNIHVIFVYRKTCKVNTDTVKISVYKY